MREPLLMALHSPDRCQIERNKVRPVGCPCATKQLCAEDGDSEGEQGMREPLLMALDGDEGSVGSEDTTNCSLSDFGDFESRAPGERREGPLGGGSYVVDSPEVRSWTEAALHLI